MNLCFPSFTIAKTTTFIMLRRIQVLDSCLASGSESWEAKRKSHPHRTLNPLTAPTPEANFLGRWCNKLVTASAEPILIWKFTLCTYMFLAREALGMYDYYGWGVYYGYICSVSSQGTTNSIIFCISTFQLLWKHARIAIYEKQIWCLCKDTLALPCVLYNKFWCSGLS